MSKKIYLIDGNSFIYRMFFALPEFSTKKGKPVNATFWMAKFFMWQLVKEKPDYLVFIKDAKGENFRHELYADYKATRDRMPDNLKSQISDIESMIQKMNIDIIEIPWYEADDIIATLAKKLSEEEKNEIYILSGDKDLYALVDEQVKIYDTQRKKISGPDETFEKFWVPASCVTDYLAICWDSSDNIPGISGIWPKKAQVLLCEFWSLGKIYEVIENLEDNYDTISPESQKILKGKTLEKFIDGKQDAFLSQKLATLEIKVDLPHFNIHDFEFSPERIQTPEIYAFFEEFEFFSLIEDKKQELKKWENEKKKVNIIGDSRGVQELEEKLKEFLGKEIFFDTETTSLNPREAELVGVSLMLWEEIFYINLWHGGAKVEIPQMKGFLRNILEWDFIIIGHNLKYDLQVVQVFLDSKNTDIQKSQEESHWQLDLWL